MTVWMDRFAPLACLLSCAVICSTTAAQQDLRSSPFGTQLRQSRQASLIREPYPLTARPGLLQPASHTQSIDPVNRVDPRQTPHVNPLASPQMSQQTETPRGASSSGGNVLRPTGTAEAATPNSVSTLSTEQPDPNVKPAVAVELAESIASVTQTNIDALIKSVNEAVDLDAEQKKEALDRLKGATDWLKNANDLEGNIKEYQADIDNAPAELETAKAARDASAGEPQFDIPPDATLSHVEQKATDAETRLKQARDALGKREESLKRRSERQAELTKLISEIDQRLEDAEKILVSEAGESTLVQIARHAENQARYIALEKQKTLYPLELRRIDARAELVPLLRDLAKREVAFLEKESAGWQKMVADFRKQESEHQAAEAQRQVQNAHPALKSFAKNNSELAEKRKALVAVIEKIEKEIQKCRQVTNQLKVDFDKISEKVEKAGHSTATGFLLRRHRDQLPDVSDGRDRIRFVRQETPKIHLSALDLQDDRDALGDLDSAVASVVAQLDGAILQYDQQYVEQMVTDLLQTTRDVLDDHIRDHDQYIILLGELELSQRELLDESDRFVTYIDERVLWIRSSDPIGRADVDEALMGLKSLALPGKWLDVGRAIRGRAVQQPWSVMLGIVAVAVLLLCRDRLRQQINRICESDETKRRHRFLPTVEAIAALSLAAALWPGLIWLIGWQLTVPGEMPELGRACGVGLQSAAFVFWIAKLSRQLCRRGGVAERHFEWNGDGMSAVRRHVAWLAILGVPLVFFVSAITVYDAGRWDSSLGRIAFLTGCLLLMLFTHCLLRLNGGVFGSTCMTTPNAWFCRFRHAMYILAVGIPLALAVVAVLGYGYSAQRLAARLQTTVAVGFAVMLLRALAIRWLAVRQQRLLCDTLSDNDPTGPQSSSANSTASVATTNRSDVESTLPESSNSQEMANDDDSTYEELAADVQQSDSQVRYLLRYAVAALLLAGGYWIWADVTPALGVLDKVELWSKWVEIKETLPSAEGPPQVVTTQKEVATTLKHAILAGFILVLGLVLARNLPALLDVLILERMPIDKGQRYAAGMILRYIVTLAGLIIACQEMGFTWSSIQWLAAAMTVGLGFGLQEIFANLVSGLIILFERPVRVGDLVTVCGVTGRVTRMQIRATTITDFDRRELIVPNKKFITEDVMNWTLSDNINRVVVEVGVAYGSDTYRARELMLRVSRRHPLVLDQPKPSVTFDKFADSSLNFTLRCYLPNLDDRLSVIHELHAEIDREFRQARIEIAFPQQDLHVRTVDAAFLRGEQPKKDAA